MRTLGMDPNDDEAWAAAVDGIADEVDALGITSTPDTWVLTRDQLPLYIVSIHV